jgi:hypothetical protein
MDGGQFQFWRVLILLGAGLLLTQCSNNNPTSSNGVTASSSPYFISSVLNYGVQNDGNVYFVLDGTFPGTGDVIFSSCLNSGNPKATMVSESTTQILFYISPSALSTPIDSCSFFEEGEYQNINISGYVGVQATHVSSPALVSNSQTGLVITQVTDTGPDATPSNGFDDIKLTGSFVGSANGGDLVWSQCDSATTFTQAQAATTGGVDTTSQIVVVITTPQNFSSCQFIVTGNNVQSLIVNPSGQPTNEPAGFP